LEDAQEKLKELTETGKDNVGKDEIEKLQQQYEELELKHEITVE